MNTRIALVLSFLLVAAAPAASAPSEPSSAQAKITYVSGTTVYLDAGTDQGLAVGDVVEVVRDGNVVARLTVGFVTEKRSSATAESSTTDLKTGDVVRYTPRVAAAPVLVATPAPATPAPAPRPGRAGRAVRGRVGVRYLWIKDKTGFGQDLRQPSLDLRLVGTQVGGAPFDFDVDFRPRRTYRSRSDGTSSNESSNRIYTLNGTWRPGSFRVVLGRQTTPSLAPIGLFDGVLAEFRRSRWGVGGFAGSEPDPVDWNYSSDVKDYGAYVATGSRPGVALRWGVDLGALSSTENGEINRDLVYLSSRLSKGGFNGWMIHQFDVNRGWRKEAEGSSMTRSGSYVSMRWQISPSWTLNSGWDSRRNVRLYRDLVTPVTDFDDAYRQGYWGGVDGRFKNRWVAGLDGRSSSGGTAGSADAYTARFGVINLTRVNLEARVRATTYSGPRIDGNLYAINVGADLGRPVHLDVHGGARKETDKTGFTVDRSVNWVGLNLDLLPGRRTFATLSYDHTSGGDEDNDQVYTSFSWRF